MKQYSFLKGLSKAATQVGIFALSAVLVIGAMNFQSVLDTQLWALVEQYLKPILGTLTVGGAFTLALNWLKNRKPA